ncbi:MAG: TonB-dependent receptor [Gammaproteobacteria bacterium]
MRLLTVASAICGAVLGLASATEVAASIRKPISIPAQALEPALYLFAKDRDLQLIYKSEVVGDLRTVGATGELTADEALKQLLSGTGLTFRYLDDRTVTIMPPPAVAPPAGAAGGKRAQAHGAVRVAQLEAQSAAQADDPNRTKTADSRSSSSEEADDALRKGVPEILIEGSKILNTDIARTRDDAQPYVIFNRDTVRQSGAANLEDFLKQRLPMNSQGKANAQQATSTIKTSQINLRGLGANQTLILIDGHRAPLISYFGGTSQADLNGVPLAAIERIEVLPATASGIYGGGATGGVVNVILRRDYTGAEVGLGYGSSFSSDASSYRADFSGGFTAGENTSFLLSGSYSDTDGLRADDRDFLERGLGRIRANNPSLLFAAANPPLGATTNLRSVNGSPLFGPGTPNYASVPAGYAGGGGLAALQQNAGQYNLDPSPSAYPAQAAGSLGLLPQTSNSALSVVARHQFSPGIQGFLSLSASRNVARTSYATQTPVFTVAASAPNNPFGQAILVSVPTAAANGTSVSKTEAAGATGGLIFKLPSDWVGEADYTWSGGELFWRNPPIFAAGAAAGIANGSLDVLRDLDLNPLDLSAYLQGQPGYPVSDPPFKTHFGDAVLRFSGPLGSVWGGPIKVSSLIERQETRLSDAAQIYASAAFAYYYPRHSQTVDSFYLEARLPLISAKNRIPGVEELELQLAGRGDRYTSRGASPALYGSSTGPDAQAVTHVETHLSSTNPTIALSYKPTQDVMFRASYGTGFFVPDLSLLASQPEQTISSTLPVTDPRRGNSPFFRWQGISGGNASLKPEKSKSVSFGFVLQPRILPEWRLSLDYTKIDKTDNIINPSVEQLLDNEATLPGRVIRGPKLPGDPADWAGPVILFDGSALNIATAEVQAYDAQLDYTKATQRAGTFSAFIYATWEPHYRTQVVPTAPVVENVGIGNFSLNNPLKLRANLGLNWSARGWRLGWLVNYYDSYLVSLNAVNVATQGNGGKIPVQTYHDVFVSYRFAGALGTESFVSSAFDGLEVQLGAQNVFNTRPPVDVSNSALYSWFGDPRLSRYSLSLKKSF